MADSVFVTFVHGYEDLDFEIDRDDLPALWRVNGAGTETFRYPFPRNIADFHDAGSLIAGAMPKADAEEFKRLPRFGFTGAALCGDYLYAGSWNGVYRIRRSDAHLDRIISNPMMSDLHGIWVGEDLVLTVLTGKDAVVLSDFDGQVIDHFCIGRDLEIYRDPTLNDVDWRFVSKQFRGATGFWHFNYIQMLGEEIWLTSRNAGCFLVIDPIAGRAELRLINHKTPVLLHDGRCIDGRFFFTSIDGKLIITEPAEQARANPREAVDRIHLYNRDMVSEVVRLADTELGREPNWCRGVDCAGQRIYLTIDGRYDSDLSFGLIALEESGHLVSQHRLNWSDVGDETRIRYVTGFDVAVDQVDLAA